MLRLLLHGDAGGFVVGFFGVREDEHQITFQRLVPEYTCPQQPLPASSDVLFLKLDFVCCMGIIWLSSDTCLVLVGFFLPALLATFHSSQGYRCWRHSADKIPCPSPSTDVGQAPVCPKISPAYASPRAKALFLGEVWLWFQLRRIPLFLLLGLPGPMPRPTRSGNPGQIYLSYQNPHQTMSPVAFAAFCSEIWQLYAPTGHFSVPLQWRPSTCWSGCMVPLSLAMVDLHPGRRRLQHCGCILLFSSLPSLAVNSDIVKNVDKKFMLYFFF